MKQVNLNLMISEKHGSTYSTLQKSLMIYLTKEDCVWDREVKFQKYT